MILKNGMVLTIEKATKDDAEKVVNYLNVVGGESDNLTFGLNGFGSTVEAEEEFIENLLTSNTSAMFIGKVDGEIMCVGNVTGYKRERLAHQSDIAISVKKEFWGMGVGSCLMQTMIDFARGTGTTEILHLGVRAGNETAMKLYRKMGFEEIGRNKNLFKIQGVYHDEILMNLYL